jgi:hypothetical protein
LENRRPRRPVCGIAVPQVRFGVPFAVLCRRFAVRRHVFVREIGDSRLLEFRGSGLGMPTLFLLARKQPSEPSEPSEGSPDYRLRTLPSLTARRPQLLVRSEETIVRNRPKPGVEGCAWPFDPVGLLNCQRARIGTRQRNAQSGIRIFTAAPRGRTDYRP